MSQSSKFIFGLTTALVVHVEDFSNVLVEIIIKKD